MCTGFDLLQRVEQRLLPPLAEPLQPKKHTNQNLEPKKERKETNKRNDSGGGGGVWKWNQHTWPRWWRRPSRRMEAATMTAQTAATAHVGVWSSALAPSPPAPPPPPPPLPLIVAPLELPLQLSVNGG